MIENSTITVGAFRGTFRAFLEIHHASITSLRGIFWHNGVVLKDCEIVQPQGGVYDAIERAISLHGRIFQRKVVIERMKNSGITPPEVKATEKSFYNIHGQLVTCPDKGFFIVKHANGKVEKVIR